MNAQALTRYLLVNRRAILLGLAAVALVALGVSGATLVATDFTPGSQVSTKDPAAPGFDLADSDGDGIPDIDEIVRWGTNVTKRDTDDDGIPDWWEARFRQVDPLSGRFLIDPLLADGDADTDGDGLSDLQEYFTSPASRPLTPGTSPLLADSDGDGMSDGYEVRHGLDPLDPSDATPDLDEDGLTNLEESGLGTNPRGKDTDGDGIPDADEVAGAVTLQNRRLTFTPTDPARFSTGGNAIADGWAVFFAIDPHDANAAYLDPDGDGLSNADEYLWSAGRHASGPNPDKSVEALLSSTLSPHLADSDGDLLPDGWEVRYGLNPLSAADATDDPDDDGLTNLQEFAEGSNPLALDSDGDGLRDDVEVLGWTIEVDGRTAQVRSSPSMRDSDSDGLTDAEEREGRVLLDGVPVTFSPTDPRLQDTDFDALLDANEVFTRYRTARLDPTLADTDGDGLKDGEEVAFWKARQSDLQASLATDGVAAERLLNEYRIRMGTTLDNNALVALLAPEGDVDGDGVPNVLDADSDGDQGSDGDEWNPQSREGRAVPGTAPWLLDTDGDELPDRWELQFMQWDAALPGWNLNPADADSDHDGVSDRDEDLDTDGVPRKGYKYTNAEELRRGTNPVLRDSDGDGIADGWEVYYDRFHKPVGHSGTLLDPTDGTDAGEVVSVFKYSRLVKTTSPLTGDALLANLTESGVLDAGREETFDPDQAAPGSDGDARYGVTFGDTTTGTVVRVHGIFRLTYLIAFQNNVDPSIDPATGRVQHDTDGDAMPDAWEVFHRLRNPDTGNRLDPSVDDANRDADGDALTNQNEYLGAGDEARPQFWDDAVMAYGHGTDPNAEDTDFDGLRDGFEARDGLNPRNPYDAQEDLDGDGLSNREEGARRTSAREVDTDRDGLLDGRSITLATDAASPRQCLKEDCLALFLRLGIVHDRPTLTEYRFFGELDLDIQGRRVSSDPTRWDTDNDGMPDGWEVRYTFVNNTDGTVFDPTAFSAGASDGDDLPDVLEYLLGRPSWWSEPVHGPWWLGGTPIRTDSDGDCADLGDGRGIVEISCQDGAPGVGGGERDYDNDGLDDFNGEDPYPFANPANLPGATPLDAYNATRWLEVGRPLSWRAGPPDADGVPYARARAEARVVVTGISGPALTAEDGVLFIRKGIPFHVEGRVTAGGIGVPNVSVLVSPHNALDPGIPLTPVEQALLQDDPSRILCAGFTNPAGDFNLTCAFQRNQAATVPDGAVLFGAVGGTRSWTYDTQGVPLGPLGLHVWTYATDARTTPGNATYGDWPARGRDLTGTMRTFTAHAVTGNNTRVTCIPAGCLALRTDSHLTLQPEAPFLNAGTLQGKGRLLDGAGDPIPGEGVRLTWDGNTTFATTNAQGEFTYSFPIRNLTFPRALTLDAAFAGSDLVLPSTATEELKVQFRTRVVADPAPVLVAGSTSSFKGKVLDERGNPVANARVSVDLRGMRVESRTNVRGEYDLRLPVPDTARAGAIEGTVDHLGNAEFLAASTPVQTIVKKPTRVVLDPLTPTGFLGKPYEVKGRIVDLAGAPVRPLATETLVVELLLQDRGLTLTGTVVPLGPTGGTFVITVPPEQLGFVGRFPILVRFQESFLFSGSEVATEMVVRSDVRILVEDTRLERNAPFTLGGRVLDALNSPVPNHGVNVTLGGKVLSAVTTDAQGRFRIELNLPANQPLGPLSLKTATPETASYTRAEHVTTLTVIARTTLVLDDKASFKGPVTLDGQLFDDGGNAVPDAPIRIRVAGVPIGTTYTDRAGAFSVLYVIPHTTPAGRVELSASYAGAPLLGPATDASHLTVLADTNLTITKTETPSGRHEVVRGDRVRLAGTLHEDNGNPVTGGKVVVSLNGARLSEAVTLNGVWNLDVTIPRDAALGLGRLEAFFPGKDDLGSLEESALRASSANVTLPVKELARLIFVDVPKEATSDARARVRLADSSDRGVANVTLYVNLGGRTIQMTTDATGNLSFPIVAYGNATTTLPIEITYAGDDTLAAARATNAVPLRAAPAPASAAGVGALVAFVLVLLAMAAVGALVIMRRRGAKEARQILAEAEASILAGDEVRAVLYLAYRKLKSSLARQGHMDDKADTMREFISGLQRVLPVDRDPLHRLATLLEEARYTDRAVTPETRREALDILRVLDIQISTALGSHPQSSTGRPPE